MYNIYIINCAGWVDTGTHMKLKHEEEKNEEILMATVLVISIYQV